MKDVKQRSGQTKKQQIMNEFVGPYNLEHMNQKPRLLYV